MALNHTWTAADVVIAIHAKSAGDACGGLGGGIALEVIGRVAVLLQTAISRQCDAALGVAITCFERFIVFNSLAVATAGHIHTF
jgi:hypothetical protein